jgi:cell division transport system permease protein
LAFLRNGLQSTATIIILSLVLLGFAGLLVFNSVANLILEDVQDKVDISVYFKTDTSEDDILNVQRSLESLSEVKSVEYISKDQALKIFKSQHQNEPIISQSIEELLDTNPLSASLNIKARDLKDYSTIAAYLEKQQFKNLIDKVSYAQNEKAIERLKNIKNNVGQGGLALLIFMSVAAAFIIFNTIRLAIFSNREELGIMRLVGASNFFIRGPYLLEGVIYGFIGSLVSIILISIIIYYIAPHFNNFIPKVNGWSYYSARILKLFLYQLLFGVGLGVLSSYFAVRKYLKV